MREFVELGGRVLGTTDLKGTLAALRDDPRLRFDNADEVFETAKRSLVRAQAAMSDWFGRIPGAACVVVPVPSHSEQHQTIAYYSWPAMDGSRPGRYYINLYAPETRPRYEAEALAFHEAVPGHHLQIAIAQELPGLPAFQRALGSTAFSEGWGLYTERLSDEMGLYTGDMDRFGVLSYDAWRAGRLVVDTGHACARLDPPAGDRFPHRPHGAGREQHRQRGRPLHRDARAGPRLQDRAARDPAAP